MENKGHIKINLPESLEGFKKGLGEGIWIEIDMSFREIYNGSTIGGSYEGKLLNDSVYYPLLEWGSTVRFELRGSNRPVAFFEDLQPYRDDTKKKEIIDILHARYKKH